MLLGTDYTVNNFLTSVTMTSALGEEIKRRKRRTKDKAHNEAMIRLLQKALDEVNLWQETFYEVDEKKEKD